MKRFILALVVASLVLASLLGASQARAESSKAVQVLVTCDSGPYPSFYTTLPPLGQAVTIPGSTRNFVTVTLTVAYAAGATDVLHNSQADPRGQALVTCHSVGPFTGNNYTLVGFFTPVGG